jgi:hypothetical protein
VKEIGNEKTGIEKVKLKEGRPRHLPEALKNGAGGVY